MTGLDGARGADRSSEGGVTVFVKLLGEGVDVWRPVLAHPDGDGFRLIEDAPEGEWWTVPSGSVAWCSVGPGDQLRADSVLWCPADVALRHAERWTRALADGARGPYEMAHEISAAASWGLTEDSAAGWKCSRVYLLWSVLADWFELEYRPDAEVFETMRLAASEWLGLNGDERAEGDYLNDWLVGKLGYAPEPSPGITPEEEKWRRRLDARYGSCRCDDLAALPEPGVSLNEIAAVRRYTDSRHMTWIDSGPTGFDLYRCRSTGRSWVVNATRHNRMSARRYDSSAAAGEAMREQARVAWRDRPVLERLRRRIAPGAE